MTELSELILKEYQTRRTKKQKLKFIELLKKYIPDLKIEEGGFLHNRNIVVGDVEKAKVILGAHYDTCALLPFPNLCMPKNIIIMILFMLLVCIPFFVILVLFDYLAELIVSDPLILFLISNVFMITFFVLLFLIGIPSKHTANDNTSGTITIIELILNMTEEEKRDVAFVLFDNEENGLFGSSFFASKHKKNLSDKLLINLDCVSDGNHLLVIQSKLAKKRYESFLKESFKENDDKKVYFESALTTYYPSDQLNFKNAIALSFMNKSIFGLYMDKIHTKKDVVFDKSNIEYLCNSLKDFITKI